MKRFLHVCCIALFILTACSAVPDITQAVSGPEICKGNNANLADHTGNVDGWNITEKQGVVWAYFEDTGLIEVFWFNYGYLSDPVFYEAVEGLNTVSVMVPDVELNGNGLSDLSATINPVICGTLLYSDPDVPPTYEILDVKPYPENPEPLYPPIPPEGLPDVLG